MSSHDDLKKPLLISDDYNDENTPLISATVAMDKSLC